MSNINLISPAGFTTGVLIADTVETTGGSPDSISTMTLNNNAPVSAALEIQSTLGSLLIPRMTTAQRNALNAIDGMIIYNTDISAYNFLENDAWFTLSNSVLQTIAVTGTISSAQIKGMYATPVTLLAAPGAGIAYVIQSLTIWLVYNTITYANGGNVYLQYGMTAHGGNFATSNAAIPNGFVNGAISQIIYTTGLINGTSGLSLVVTGNQPISITNDTAPFITGNSTINYQINYSVIAL